MKFLSACCFHSLWKKCVHKGFLKVTINAESFLFFNQIQLPPWVSVTFVSCFLMIIQYSLSFSFTFLLNSLSDKCIHAITLFLSYVFPLNLSFFPHSMGQPTNLFLTLLFLLLSPCWGQSSHPSCDRCDQQLSCNCSYGEFTSVPTVTERALTLDLSFNNITMVAADDLTGHAQLRVLNLHGNADGILFGL